MPYHYKDNNRETFCLVPRCNPTYQHKFKASSICIGSTYPVKQFIFDENEADRKR